MPTGQRRPTSHARRTFARVARKNSKFHTPRRPTKRGAYKLKNKKAFKRMSNPLAENKQLLGSEIAATVGLDVDNKVVLTDYSTAPYDSTGTLTGAPGHVMNTMHWHFNPDSMMYQTQGLDESQMIGRSTYQTLCAAKFLIKWPQPSMDTGIARYGGGDNLKGVIPDRPMSYKLYWGFVPKKLLFTGETDPDVNEASAFDIETAINQRVSDYFNARQDRIQFIPKKTATINIIGSKTLRPSDWANRKPTSVVYNTDENDDGDLTIKHGDIPDTLVKIKWPINRKIHFEPSNKFGHRSASGTDPATNIALANGATVFYRNYDHLPFAVIVSWNHEALPVNNASATDPNDQHERTRRCPQVLVNDITYYRDS